MSQNEHVTQSTPVELAIRNSLVTQAQLILAPHLHRLMDQVLLLDAIASERFSEDDELSVEIGRMEEMLSGVLPSTTDIEIFEHFGLQLQGVQCEGL